MIALSLYLKSDQETIAPQVILDAFNATREEDEPPEGGGAR